MKIGNQTGQGHALKRENEDKAHQVADLRERTLVKRKRPKEIRKADLTVSNDIATGIKTSPSEVNSESVFRNIVEEAPDAITVHDRGILLYANRAFVRLVGYDNPEDVIGRSLFDFAPPGDNSTQDQDRHECVILDNVEHHLIEVPVVRKDGKIYLVESSGVKIIFKGHTAILNIHRNVTRRKHIEQSVMGQIIQSEKIIQSSMDGFLVMDRKGRIRQTNNAAAMITAFPEKELAGMCLHELVVRNKSGDIIRSFKKAMENGNCHFDTQFLRKDGHAIDIEISLTHIDEDKGVCFISFFRDITEKIYLKQTLEDKGRASETIIKRLEWELTQMQDKLARKDEETVGKEEFEEKVLTNLKELVNPYLYKLKKSKLNEKQTEYLHIMESNLNQIVSPFSRKLTSNFSNLTHTEVQVANLVMQGKATKEIGEVLNVSGRTIDTHRRRIRNKLGLANKKVNLRSHLLSIQ